MKEDATKLLNDITESIRVKEERLKAKELEHEDLMIEFIDLRIRLENLCSDNTFDLNNLL